MEREVDGHVGAAPAVMRPTAVMKSEPSRKAKLLDLPVGLRPSPHHGHDSPALSRDRRNVDSGTSSEMSFLLRVSGLDLRDWVRSSDLQRELLLRHVRRRQLRWFNV